MNPLFIHTNKQGYDEHYDVIIHQHSSHHKLNTDFVMSHTQRTGMHLHRRTQASHPRASRICTELREGGRELERLVGPAGGRRGLERRGAAERGIIFLPIIA